MSRKVVANDWSLRPKVVSVGGHEKLCNGSRRPQGGGSLVHPSACQCGSKSTVQTHSRFAGGSQHQDAAGSKLRTCDESAYHCRLARSCLSDHGAKPSLSYTTKR